MISIVSRESGVDFLGNEFSKGLRDDPFRMIIYENIMVYWDGFSLPVSALQCGYTYQINYSQRGGKRFEIFQSVH